MRNRQKKYLGTKQFTLLTIFMAAIGFSFVWLPPFPPSQPETATWLVLGDTFISYSTFDASSFKKKVQEKANINLKYQDEFDLKERSRRLSEGNAELILMSLNQFLKQQPQGKIVGLIDLSMGADALVLNTPKYPSLKSLEDLQELQEKQPNWREEFAYAVVPYSPSDFLLQEVNRKFNKFDLLSFKKLDDIEDSRNAWKDLQREEKNVVLAVLWEPFLTQATEKGYTIAFSSREVPIEMVRVIVASDKVLKNQPEAISDFLETYYVHIMSGIVESQLMQDQIFEEVELSMDMAEEIRRRIHFFSPIEVESWFNEGKFKELIEKIEKIKNAEKTTEIPEKRTEIFTVQYLKKAITRARELCEIVKKEEICKGTTILENPSPPVNPNSSISPSPLINSNPSPSPTLPSRESLNSLTVEPLYFEQDSSELTSRHKQSLNQLADKIKKLDPEQTLIVQVTGHSSDSGDEELNQSLSEQRAQAVRDYLKKGGVKNKINFDGKGVSELLPGIHEDDPKHQRAEITFSQSK